MFYLLQQQHWNSWNWKYKVSYINAIYFKVFFLPHYASYYLILKYSPK